MAGFTTLMYLLTSLRRLTQPLWALVIFAVLEPSASVPNASNWTRDQTAGRTKIHNPLETSRRAESGIVPSSP